MKKLATLLLVLGVFSVGVISLNARVSAQDAEKKTETQNTETKPAETYDYKAQPDDSYSVLARKAVQTYGIETSTNLSGAQIVFAETRLTLDAGSPVLLVGQTVSINKESVKNIVEKAKQLSDADQKLWDQYVQFVDFDTRKNGEPR